MSEREIEREIEISVIAPVYRQAAHLRTMLTDFHVALERCGAPFELIVVLNGADDGSLAICQELQATLPGIRPIAADAAGWGRSVITGLRAARGHCLCYMNSARTRVDDLVELIGFQRRNPGYVVKANRRIREDPLRIIASVLYNFECRLLFLLNNWDINGTPKVLDRSILDRLQLTETGDLIDLELIIQCNWQRIPVIDVPTFSFRRRSGRATTNFQSAWLMYSGAVRLWHRHRADIKRWRS